MTLTMTMAMIMEIAKNGGNDMLLFRRSAKVAKLRKTPQRFRNCGPRARFRTRNRNCGPRDNHEPQPQLRSEGKIPQPQPQLR